MSTLEAKLALSVRIAKLKITLRVDHVFPPIPMRDCDYAAYDENTYDGAPDAGHQIIGWGATADAATEDLLQQLEDDWEPEDMPLEMDGDIGPLAGYAP